MILPMDPYAPGGGSKRSRENRKSPIDGQSDTERLSQLLPLFDNGKLTREAISAVTDGIKDAQIINFIRSNNLRSKALETAKRTQANDDPDITIQEICHAIIGLVFVLMDNAEKGTQELLDAIRSLYDKFADQIKKATRIELDDQMPMDAAVDKLKSCTVCKAVMGLFEDEFEKEEFTTKLERASQEIENVENWIKARQATSQTEPTPTATPEAKEHTKPTPKTDPAGGGKFPSSTSKASTEYQSYPPALDELLSLFESGKLRLSPIRQILHDTFQGDQERQMAGVKNFIDKNDLRKKVLETARKTESNDDPWITIQEIYNAFVGLYLVLGFEQDNQELGEAMISLYNKFVPRIQQADITLNDQTSMVAAEDKLKIYTMYETLLNIGANFPDPDETKQEVAQEMKTIEKWFKDHKKAANTSKPKPATAATADMTPPATEKNEKTPKTDQTGTNLLSKKDQSTHKINVAAEANSKNVDEAKPKSAKSPASTSLLSSRILQLTGAALVVALISYFSWQQHTKTTNNNIASPAK